MIQAFLIINNFGKPRLLKFYKQTVRMAPAHGHVFIHSLLFACAAQPEQKQQQIVRELFATLTARAETSSSFIDASSYFPDVPGARIIYRQYATLYFCMVIDSSESELGILDLVQVLVETLDRHFKNVCELDIIFNSPEVRVCGLRRVAAALLSLLSPHTHTHTPSLVSFCPRCTGWWTR